MSMFTPQKPWKTNPGLALLHLIVWYAAAVGAFFLLAYSLSDVQDPDCQETFCASPRTGVLMAGVFLGAPALLLSLLVSLVMLGLISARRPQRPARWVGLLAATPVFVLLAVVVCVVGSAVGR
ncbi:hypothetical protein [Verrucosispora sp. WMMC514]|uniref:hypothetical protein n=1 Tax=Verrucosispora sp. WMMC514 TaxID=3015156 RepID=UPI00248C3159|nr:hypothetical protein [Verrucosispora sp. WMMC514]WBB92653.1 hypothetical protein O7597_06575 [Verrucosispora sp. WMMC514]